MAANLTHHTSAHEHYLHQQHRTLRQGDTFLFKINWILIAKSAEANVYECLFGVHVQAQLILLAIKRNHLTN